ncbi:MAG TPA: cysteine desulfurase-like protein [Actinobacteria bacterium]|jgi:cysteine desulfurase family protein (TIGR01976 family)|nr:cysteine desulfurase-like protein [Actinomycetota bacterium]
MNYDVERVRARVPALADGTAYFDGPGGTQMPDVVADAMAAVLKAGVSNRGTVTAAERRSEATVQSARMAGADLVNGDPRGIVFGRSMTELTFEVARTLAQDWGPGDEVVVTRLDHDANVRPWVTYAQRTGATVRWASFDPRTGAISPEDVLDLVNDNTRVVALTGASNLLGTRPDVAAVGAGLAGAEALLYVDGVHLTAHASVDMQAMGADFYASSPYKYLGPHIGMLAASPALLEGMHPDKLRPSTEEVPERFELGTLPYELLAGVDAAIGFLADLVAGDEGTMTRRDRIVRSMAALEEYEDALHARLRSGLEQIRGVHLHGHAPVRTPTELFTVDGVDARDVYVALAERKINAPAGSFYAIEAAEWLGLGSRGAVRAGLAPYSTAEDVDRLLEGVAALAGR